MGVELATRNEISLDIVARLMHRSTSDSPAPDSAISSSVQYDIHSNVLTFSSLEGWRLPLFAIANAQNITCHYFLFPHH
jgi:hypothetical protein